MSEKSIIKQPEDISITESIKKIAQEVRTLPQWQRDLSGFRSNYCSELQPCKGELIEKEKTPLGGVNK